MVENNDLMDAFVAIHNMPTYKIFLRWLQQKQEECLDAFKNSKTLEDLNFVRGQFTVYRTFITLFERDLPLLIEQKEKNRG